MVTRRLALAAPLMFIMTPACATTWQQKLVVAAETQIGRTVTYDPTYVKLGYPGGDVPEDRGVCTDVVIRAYRKGLSFDLQKAVHDDMSARFSAYPRHWGLKRTDRNIDHRRVPNLQTYLRLKGAKRDTEDFRPGDLVTMMLPGNLPHIGIVSFTMSDDGSRPLLVHNIGGGAQREDCAGRYPSPDTFVSIRVDPEVRTFRQRLTAIDDDRRAGDVGGVVGSQKESCVGDVARRA